MGGVLIPEGERESSFCEQKEAKKLYFMGCGLKFGIQMCVVEGKSVDPSLRSGGREGGRSMNKVFFLLFVHKKKIF